MSQASIAIIVPVHDDLVELEGLLAALGAQESASLFEVIVVDDGSTDDTAARVGRLARSFPFALRVLRQGRLGPGAARNLGARNSVCELLVFIDADARPRPGWLCALSRAMRDPSLGAVGGVEIVRGDARGFERAAAYVMTSWLTTGGMRGAKRSPARYFPRTFNMAVRREALEAAGGFPSTYDAEDLVLSARVKRAGYRLAFVPDALIEHRRERSTAELFARVRRMARGRMASCIDTPELRDPAIFVPLVLVASGALLPLLLAYGGLVAIHAAAVARSFTVGARVPLLFAVQQLAYAFGSAEGLVRERP